MKNKVDPDKILGKAEHESSKMSKHEIEERNLMLKALKSKSIYTNDGSWANSIGSDEEGSDSDPDACIFENQSISSIVKSDQL